MTTQAYKVGYLLRSAITGFVAGTKVTEEDAPHFGALVRAPLGQSMWIYGLIYAMHIDDDGMVRQIATTDQVDDAIIADNRRNRTVPLEISVLTIGHSRDGVISHLLPPRAPLSLDIVWQCEPAEVAQFTERLGYFRHVLRNGANPESPAAELLAAHLAQAAAAHNDTQWRTRATQEIITLLRDDYQTLMQVMSALADSGMEIAK
ncbi:MAG: hypothetical protein KF821_11110 [Anaerolineales bacterium]|nr:hypothetical protein [Anaerolineales bacterium]MBX3006360.1 hypothetical protein [Anaerolineales bacterium]